MWVGSRDVQRKHSVNESERVGHRQNIWIWSGYGGWEVILICTSALDDVFTNNVAFEEIISV